MIPALWSPQVRCRVFRNLVISSLTGAGLLLASCTTVGPKTQVSSSKKGISKAEMKASEDLVTPELSAAVNAQPIVIEADGLGIKEDEPRGLTILAGPGWYRAWFLAGVLMELAAERVPIREIYASEMSALIAVLFASDPKEGSFSWRLQSLRDECFALDTGTSISRLMGRDMLDVSCIERSLKKALGTQRFDTLSIPVHLATADHARSNFVSIHSAIEWKNTGPLVPAIIAGLSFPKLMEVGKDRVPEGRCGVLCADPDELLPVKRLSAEGRVNTVAFDFAGVGWDRGSEPNGDQVGILAYGSALHKLGRASAAVQIGEIPVVSPFGPEHPVFEPSKKNDYIYMGRRVTRDSVSRWIKDSPAP